MFGIFKKTVHSRVRDAYFQEIKNTEGSLVNNKRFRKAISEVSAEINKSDKNTSKVSILGNYLLDSVMLFSPIFNYTICFSLMNFSQKSFFSYRTLEKFYKDPTRKPLKTVLSVIFGAIGGMIGYKAGFSLAAWGAAYIVPVGLIYSSLIFLLAIRATDIDIRQAFIGPFSLGVSIFGLMWLVPTTAPFLASALTASVVSRDGVKYAKQLLRALRCVSDLHPNSSSNAPSYALVEGLLKQNYDAETIGCELARIQKTAIIHYNLSASANGGGGVPFFTRVATASKMEEILKTEALVPNN